jgi:hypothetical protein
MEDGAGNTEPSGATSPPARQHHGQPSWLPRQISRGAAIVRMTTYAELITSLTTGPPDS